MRGKALKRKSLKRIISSLLSLILCLSVAGCGKSEEAVTVDEYGGKDISSSETAAVVSEDEIKLGDGSTVRDIYGERVEWEDAFAVNGISFKVDAYYNVPDLASMKVFENERLTEEEDNEETMVKSLFGDSVKKIDVIRYTNSTDYMLQLYKLRRYSEIMDIFPEDGPVEGETYTWKDPEYSVIDSSFTTEYEWVDNDNKYIHMYEGTIDGNKYVLISAYDKQLQVKRIYLAPKSIREYFPEHEYNSMMVTTTNNYQGEAIEVENACQDNIEDLTKKAEGFLISRMGVEGEFTVSSESLQYETSHYDLLSDFVNIQSWGGVNKGESVLNFSSCDYLSLLKSGSEGKGIEYSILAEQRDLFAEYKEEKENADIQSFLNNSSDGLVTNAADVDKTIDGYAVYMGCEYQELSDPYKMGYLSPGNTGIIEYTSKGLFCVDLTLYDKNVNITEDVSLLDFDMITESLKEQLPDSEDFNTELLGDPNEVKITVMNLNYYPDYEKKDENGEINYDVYTYIPVWEFQIMGDTDVDCGGDIIVNAMDGSIVNIAYWSMGM